MMWEERLIAQQNREFYRDNQRMLDAANSQKLKPITTAVQIPSKPPARQELPWVKEVTEFCQTCGGSGADPGAIDPEGELCPTCRGLTVEKITRNYLSEAFAILGNPESTRVPEREHLLAIAQYAHRAVADAHRSATDLSNSLTALRQFLPEVA